MKKEWIQRARITLDITRGHCQSLGFVYFYALCKRLLHEAEIYERQHIHRGKSRINRKIYVI